MNVILPILLAGFFLLFPLFWMFIIWVVSQMGWQALARSYRMHGEFYGETRTFQSGVLNRWVNYNNVLIVGWNGEGLFLHVFFLFRINHPPIFIPWEEIARSEMDSWFWFKRLRLHTADRRAPMITLYGGIAKIIFDHHRRYTGEM